MIDNNIGLNHNQNRTSINKKITIFLVIYILLNGALTYIQKDRSEIDTVISKIKDKQQAVEMQDLLKIFKIDEVYQGKWSKIQQNSQFLLKKEGDLQLRLMKYIDRLNLNYFEIVFDIIDGQFIDQGTINYQFRCSNQIFSTEILNNSTQILYLKDNNTINGKYDKDYIFVTVDIGSINATIFNVSYEVHSEDNIGIEFIIRTKQAYIKLKIKAQIEPNMLKAVIFAIFLTVVSYFPFSALLNILKDIEEQRDSAENYSFVTVCGTSMWDTVVCLVSLVFAFTNQQYLIIFMFPAFIMCLLFANLEPKLLLLVYQKSLQDINLRELICKFNLVHYGTLMLIYPIIIITNFNKIFFILLCCLPFSQIYQNAVNNIRPNISSDYYLKFILSRYLLVFYIKCFPNNIFKFRPDYTLGCICIFILSLQFALLYIQKIYGAKKVVPEFMLPPTYNYNYQYEQQFNLEEGSQVVDCSICLNPLHQEPPCQTNILEVSYRLMKTPCKHRYHSSCLIQWMHIKKECPECRASLPPYE